MTRVDFYILGEGGNAARDLAVCKLANKAFGMGHRVYILAAGDEEAERLDQLLWTFSAGSFIPHAHASDRSGDDAPVLVGTGAPPEAFHDVLVTTAPAVPECFSRFERVAEVVSGDEEDKRLARERFRFYRDRGYALHKHEL